MLIILRGINRREYAFGLRQWDIIKNMIGLLRAKGYTVDVENFYVDARIP